MALVARRGSLVLEKFGTDMATLVEHIAAGIHTGLVRDGWLPKDLAACQRKGETVDEMLWRFAHERANNIAGGIKADHDLAAELEAVAA